MEANVKITTDINCSLIILDLTEYSESLKKEDTVSVIALEDIDGNILDAVISYDIVSRLYLSKDGYLKLSFTILPLEDLIIDKEVLNLYYFDGVNIHKTGSDEPVGLRELIDINTYGTNIIRLESNFTSVCHLKKCYELICRNSICKLDKCATGNEYFERDLLLMSINIINYLIDFGQGIEADSIIKLMHSCNGVCKSSNIEPDRNGCGCS